MAIIVDDCYMVERILRSSPSHAITYRKIYDFLKKFDGAVFLPEQLLNPVPALYYASFSCARGTISITKCKAEDTYFAIYCDESETYRCAESLEQILYAERNMLFCNTLIKHESKALSFNALVSVENANGSLEIPTKKLDDLIDEIGIDFVTYSPGIFFKTPEHLNAYEKFICGHSFDVISLGWEELF